MAVADDGYTREALLASGWQQGSLLPADTCVSAVAWINDESQGHQKARKDAASRRRAGKLDGPYVYERATRPTDRMVLITQDCDIVKSPDEFPYVEFALVLETQKDGVVGEADTLTSARFFRMGDPGDGPPVRVLDVRFKAQADKGFLVTTPPDNTLLATMTERRRAALRIWLGRRLGREAVSDDDSRRIVEPVRSAWKQLCADSPERAQDWAAMTSELRFRHADGRLRLYAVTHEGIDPANPDVLEMLSWIVEAIDWPSLSVDLTITSEWTMTIGEHKTTQEIDLAWASYEEGFDEEEQAA